MLMLRPQTCSSDQIFPLQVKFQRHVTSTGGSNRFHEKVKTHNKPSCWTHPRLVVLLFLWGETMTTSRFRSLIDDTRTKGCQFSSLLGSHQKKHRLWYTRFGMTDVHDKATNTPRGATRHRNCSQTHGTDVQPGGKVTVQFSAGRSNLTNTQVCVNPQSYKHDITAATHHGRPRYCSALMC